MFGLIRGLRRFSAALFFSAALGLVGSTSAWGAILAYDSFSGTPGVPVTQTSTGTGFAGSWTTGSFGADNSAGYVQQGSSLENPYDTSLGGRVASLATYSLGSGISRTLSSSIGAAGSTVYLSMLVRADGTLNEGASGGFFGLVLDSNSNQNLFIGKGTGSNYLLQDVGGNNSHVSSTSAAVGQTDLLVVEAQFGTNGSPDTFTLYVDPTPTSLGPATVKSDSVVGMVSSISIFSTGAFSMDEIRIGTTLADVMPAGTVTGSVVPEPASVVLLSLGGLGVAVARLRRRSAR